MLLKATLASCLFFLAGFALTSSACDIKRYIITDTVPAPGDEGDIFNKVEVEARYPGGDNEWRKFLEKNINADVAVRHKAPAGIYTVVVQFVVDREGRVSDIRALTNHGYGMEEEVIRLLKRAPLWEPAIQEGRKVKAYRKQPVTFQVVEEEKKKRKNKDDD